jgi:hypothetical protein
VRPGFRVACVVTLLAVAVLDRSVAAARIDDWIRTFNEKRKEIAAKRCGS